MKLVIEVPVDTDGKLGTADTAIFRLHLERAVPGLVERLQRDIFDPEPRMLGTICRFRFGRPEIKVE